MSVTTDAPFLIGSWRIEPSRHCLMRDGEEVQLAPKFIQVLLCLAEQPGAVVTREALLDRVWPDVVVGEAVLTRAISVLRKTFGDDPRAPAVIETVLKGGYRLIAPVTQIPPTPALPPVRRASPRWRSATPANLALLGVAAVLLAMIGLTREAPLAASPFTDIDLAVRPLTALPGEEFDPSLSPRGTQLAFVWKPALPGTPDLYLKTVGTEALTRLTEDAAIERYPRWSPDGQYVAYFRCETTGIALMLHTVATQATRAVTRLPHLSCARLSRIAWSPDGRWLAFADQAGPQQPTHLVRLDLETQARYPLTTPPEAYTDDTTPAFSPDGQRLAFVRGGHDVLTVSLDGSVLQPLALGIGAVEGLDWSPSLGVLVATAGRLWSATPDGLHPLSSSPAYTAAPTAARATRRVAYEQTAYDVNLWHATLTAEAAAPTPLAPSTRIDGDPRISPDGQQVAFISDRAGTCGLWLTAPDRPARHLAEIGEQCMEMAYPRWSPDGGRLAFTRQVEGQREVFVVGVLTGVQRRLTFSDADEAMPSWSVDGATIFFASDRDGTWQIYEMPAATGEQSASAMPRTEHGGYVAFEAASGEHLYYTKPGQPGLWTNAGGTDWLLVPNVHLEDTTDWRVVPDGLYYIDRSGDSPAWTFFDLTTGTPHHHASLPFPGCLRADIAPDGTWMVFARVDYSTHDIMLLEPRL